MKRADIPSSSEMYQRDSTPLPYPEAGHKESDDEEEENDKEAEEENAGEGVRADDPTPVEIGNPPSTFCNGFTP